MKNVLMTLIAVGFILAGCKDSQITQPENETTKFRESFNPGTYGESTSIVVYVNPTVNAGTTGNIVMGTQKQGVAISIENRPPVFTDEEGVAVLTDVPVKENLAVSIEGSVVYVDVITALDQYDVIVKYKDNVAVQVTDPIRYKYNQHMAEVSSLAELNQALRENNITVYLKQGVYDGDIELRGNHICLIGQWDPNTGFMSTVNGNVTVYGNNSCIFDLAVNGDLTVKGNSFEITYSKFNAVSIEKPQVTVLKNDVTSGVVNVTAGSGVLLLDNINIP